MNPSQIVATGDVRAIFPMPRMMTATSLVAFVMAMDCWDDEGNKTYSTIVVSGIEISRHQHAMGDFDATCDGVAIVVRSRNGATAFGTPATCDFFGVGGDGGSKEVRNG